MKPNGLMKFRKKSQILALCFLAVAALSLGSVGCGSSSPSSNNNDDGGGGLPDTPTGSLTAETIVSTDWAANADIDVGGGEITTGVAAVAGSEDDCDLASYNVVEKLDGVNTRLAVSYIPNVAHSLTDLEFRLSSSNSPTGNINVELRSNSGGNPGTLIATSSAVDSTLVNGLGSDHIFSFSGEPQLSILTTYHFVLIEGLGYTGSGDNVGWLENNGACTPTGSGTFGLVRYDDGAWNNSVDQGVVISVEAGVEFEIDESTNYVIDAGASATWDLSSFQANENPSSEVGTILYDIEVSDSATDPPASYDDITLSSESTIQSSSSDLTGRYMHVRVNLNSGSSKYDDATLGDITIDQYQ